MEPIHITYNELLIYVVIGGIIIGALLGLIPLLLGIKKKKRNYGMYGFVASIIGGAISPLISLIVVSIFIWLILKKTNEKPVETVYADESPIETDVNDTRSN